jgi:hypothetical protein
VPAHLDLLRRLGAVRAATPPDHDRRQHDEDHQNGDDDADFRAHRMISSTITAAIASTASTHGARARRRAESGTGASVGGFRPYGARIRVLGRLGTLQRVDLLAERHRHLPNAIVSRVLADIACRAAEH